LHNLRRWADTNPDRTVSLARRSLRNDPILGHFHFVHAAKREEKLHHVFRRIAGGLADDCAYGVSNRGMEQDRAYLYAGKVYAHLLTWMQHAYYFRPLDRC